MKNKKHWFILVVILMIAAVSLTACGGEEASVQEQPAQEEAIAEEPVEEPATGRSSHRAKRVCSSQSRRISRFESSQQFFQ